MSSIFAAHQQDFQTCAMSSLTGCPPGQLAESIEHVIQPYNRLSLHCILRRTMSTALSNVFGGLFAAALLLLDGKGGLHGWQVGKLPS